MLLVIHPGTTHMCTTRASTAPRPNQPCTYIDGQCVILGKRVPTLELSLEIQNHTDTRGRNVAINSNVCVVKRKAYHTERELLVLLGGLSNNQPILAVFECLTFRAAVNVPSTSNSAMMRGFLATVMADIAVQCGRRTVVQNGQRKLE